MAYLALYRVWRPQTFIEVVGQEQTVIALQNAIREDRLTHAYIFSGPRGTGKTSIAKIVAKAVNCEHPVDAEPCNQCSACTDINNGNFMDVIEIDAASNRGIDEIRDLRERVRVMPAQGKKKVYIIDEVHMLTAEAFNALLKTLEEPPDSVIFILATTEPQKIPSTIISRCQRFNFKRLQSDQIIARLRDAANRFGIVMEEEALALIARRANGGLRDALGMLDQVYSFKEKDISKENVLEVLGLVDDNFVADIFDAVLGKDPGTLVHKIHISVQQGKESTQLVRECSLYLRDLLMAKLIGDKAELLMVSEANRDRLIQQTQLANKDQILQLLRMTMDLAEKLRFSEGQRFLLEITFLEMIAVISGQTSKPEASPEPRKKDTTTSKDKPVKNDAREILWNRILLGVKEKKVPTHALLAQGKLLGTKGDTMYIGYTKGYRFHKERMEEKANREILDQVIKEIFNREMEIQFLFLDEKQTNDIVVQKAIEYFGKENIEIKD
ncbi:MAG TPA: DNA polymerase III subunit gamma/tau [Syntrophomonas sp.]|nr:DNA polymerase III subunit gamma/tau [Syntrophomonas sp.]HRW12686.1 DNA polymerase III subunit gamma/tau [Syntrophomonas sp.]